MANKNIINIKGNVVINITFYQLPNGSLVTSMDEVKENNKKNKHNK